MYMYICIYIFIYMYLFIYIYIYMYPYVYIIYINIHVYAQNQTYIFTYKHTYINTYIHIHAYTTGIGEWTAGVFMLHFLNRPDIMLYGDLTVRIALRDLFSLSSRLHGSAPAHTKVFVRVCVCERERACRYHIYALSISWNCLTAFS